MNSTPPATIPRKPAYKPKVAPPSVWGNTGPARAGKEIDTDKRIFLDKPVVELEEDDEDDEGEEGEEVQAGPRDPFCPLERNQNKCKARK